VTRIHPMRLRAAELRQSDERRSGHAPRSPCRVSRGSIQARDGLPGYAACSAYSAACSISCPRLTRNAPTDPARPAMTVIA